MMFLLVFPDLLWQIYAGKEVCFRWGAEGGFDFCFKTISIHHNIEISSDLDRKIQFKPSVLFVIMFRLPTMDSIKICGA